MTIREAIKKNKRFFFRTLSKRGVGVQPESKSFEAVLFSPSLAFFWALNGGERRGGGGGWSFPCLFCGTQVTGVDYKIFHREEFFLIKNDFFVEDDIFITTLLYNNSELSA